MKVLLKNGTVVNVFTGELEKTNVLIEDSRIAGVGDYNDSEADVSEDMHGKILCPGFIDGHIHIESSMLIPAEFARAALPHGTTAVRYILWFRPVFRLLSLMNRERCLPRRI